MKTRKMNKKSFLVLFIGCSCLVILCNRYSDRTNSKRNQEFNRFQCPDINDVCRCIPEPGCSQSVQVEADKASQEYIETEIHGNALVVKNREGHWHNLGHIKIYITMPDITEIELSGSGSVESQTPIKSADLEIMLSGSGNVKISSLQAPVLKANITGSGDIYLSGENDQANMDATITGSGSIKADEHEGGRCQGSHHRIGLSQGICFERTGDRYNRKRQCPLQGQSRDQCPFYGVGPHL